MRRADDACPNDLCIGNLAPLELNHTDNTQRLKFSHVYVPYTCRYRMYDSLGCLYGRRTLVLGHSRTQQLAHYMERLANETNAKVDHDVSDDRLSRTRSSTRSMRDSSAAEEALPYTVVHDVRIGERLGLPYILGKHNITHAMATYDYVVYCRCVLVWR